MKSNKHRDPTMTRLYTVLLFLTFLFLVVDAKGHKHKDKLKKIFHKIVAHPKHTYTKLFPLLDNEQSSFSDGGDDRPDYETNFLGSWEVINRDSGVSAMQIQLMPDNTVNVYDATVYRLSRLPYPKGMPCVEFYDENLKQNKQDCYAHAMEYDIQTNQVRALTVKTDPWCSCGGLTPDGSLVVAGGFADGGRTSRYYRGCKTCDWREYALKFKEPRWYATQIILPNGEFIVVGGRRSFSYEFFPKEGQETAKSIFFPFLYETSDIDENNLYPFIYLSSDGNLFVFANNRSILLNPNNNKVVRIFPVLPGGSRNYPASGMSAMLPINLDPNEIDSSKTKIEVMVCGGNTYDSFNLAETKKQFLPALKDCSRMVITDQHPKWETEDMPSGRTLGDLLVLPNGELLFINGAQKGTAAWWDADDPNFTPVLYKPEKPKGQRFTTLNPTTIARMYHSTSAVLPSGKIWVGGSNPHNTYKDVDKFPTETRVEAFSPPYLDPNLNASRPQIIEDSSVKWLRYGNNFETQFRMKYTNQKLGMHDIKITMYYPPFTTHGYSMNQRLLVLETTIIPSSEGIYRASAKAPSFPELAPPGYYLLFVVNRGVPSEAMWVHIQ